MLKMMEFSDWGLNENWMDNSKNWNDDLHLFAQKSVQRPQLPPNLIKFKCKQTFINWIRVWRSGHGDIDVNLDVSTHYATIMVRNDGN